MNSERERQEKGKAVCRELRDDLHRAERDLNDEVKRTFPVGSHVEFHRGRGWISAEVLGHYWDRIRIRNLSTGREYSVVAWWLYREGADDDE